MPINVRPLSQVNPLALPEEEYQALVQRTENGWSQCADEREWLAKLHYLRAGFKAGKLDAAQFEEREFRLVQGFLTRYF